MKHDLVRTSILAAALVLCSLPQAHAQQGAPPKAPRDRGFGGPPGGPGRPAGPGRPGAQPPPPPPPNWQPPAESVSGLRASEPEFAALLDRLKTAEPERWRGEMWHLSQEARHVATMRERGETDRATRVASTGRLERKVRAIVDGIGQEEPTEPQLTSLRESLGQLFDLREDMRREEITSLEKRITELKAGLSDRRARKGEIVDRRVKELLSESDPLGW